MGKQVGGRHYKNLAIEPERYAAENDLGWHEGEVVKYITRHASKGGAVDIRKAMHVCEMILHHRYGRPDPNDGPQTLRGLRESRGLTVTDAALKIGMAPTHLSRIERGYSASLGALEPIAEFYGVSLGWVVDHRCAS